MTTPAAPPPPWRNRIVGHGEEAPEQLLANPDNWRIHPRTQRAALVGALDAIGWVQDVIINRTTGHVIDGHLRIDAAIEYGAPTVPVVYVDLSEEEEREILATLDPIGMLAVQDAAKYLEITAGLESGNIELDAFLEEERRAAQMRADAAGSLLVDAPAAAPESFPAYDEDIPTQHRCPSCGYEWSGKTGG